MYIFTKSSSSDEVSNLSAMDIAVAAALGFLPGNVLVIDYLRQIGGTNLLGVSPVAITRFSHRQPIWRLQSPGSSP